MKLEDFKEELFDVNKACKAQSELQNAKSLPDFAPSNGRCWKCNNNIYEPIKNSGYVTGITIEKASTELVTGCPHCNRSYCD